MDYLYRECCKILNIVSLKPFQQQCLRDLLNGHNVFVSCKTGSGKSLCYECWPIVMKFYPRITLGCVVLVIEPLVSINEENIKRLKNIGFSATYIGRDDKESTSITEGLFEFIFSSAENILANEKFRVMLTSQNYQQKDVLLVIDEAHTIINWLVHNLLYIEYG